MKLYHRITALSVASCTLVACSPSNQSSRQPEAAPIVVFGAGSLETVMTAIAAEYGDAYPGQVVLNFGGSGLLTEQLMAGANADIFISASPDWIDRLEAAGRVAASNRRDLVSNTLCVISHRSSDIRIDSIETLCGGDFDYLCIADPRFVAAGGYARDWMQSHACPQDPEKTMWDRLSRKMLRTTDVRLALVQVSRTSRSIGVVYTSDYLANKDTVKLLWNVKPQTDFQIRYTAAILRESADNKRVRHLLDYLQGPEARKIFRAHGFIPLPGTASPPETLPPVASVSE